MRPLPDDLDDHDQGHDEAGEHDAPICACGVTALPAESETAGSRGFVCENPDCEAFGAEIV